MSRIMSSIGQELRIVAATYALDIATRLIPDRILKARATGLWLDVAKIGLTKSEIDLATRGEFP